MLLTLLPILFSIIFGLILWFALIRRLIDIQTKQSFNIREAVIPDIQKVNQYLITLSSSAIILTFTIIQTIKTTFSCKYLLIASWTGFTVSIFLGIILMVCLYIFRLHYHIELNEFKRASESKGKLQSKRIQTWEELIRFSSNLEKCIFTMLFLQLITFFCAIVYVVFFTTKNI